MMLPIWILIADLAAWWLTYDIAARGDETLTLICGMIAVTLVGWFGIEVYQLSESASSSRRRGAGGSDAMDE